MTTDKDQQKGYASINGLNLYYEIHGSGEPLVLLPGGFETVEAMGEIVPVLNEPTFSAFLWGAVSDCKPPSGTREWYVSWRSPRLLSKRMAGIPRYSQEWPQ